MHASDGFSLRQRIHIDVEFVHQAGDSRTFTRFLIRSGLHAVFLFTNGHTSLWGLVLMFGVKGQGLNCGWMSAVFEFHGQFRAGFTEVAQRKSERNGLVELRRTDGAADPAHLTITAIQFGSMRRNNGILEHQPDELAAHVAVGIHACYDFLSRIASFVQAESLSLKISFGRDNLFVQIRSGLREARFEAQGLSRMGSDYSHAELVSGLHDTSPSG